MFEGITPLQILILFLGIILIALVPAAALLLVVTITNRLRRRRCPYCTARIPIEATVCRFCGKQVEPPKPRVSWYPDV